MTDKNSRNRVDKAEVGVDPGRRQLLLRAGVLGAVAAVAPGLLLPRGAKAMHSGDVAWTVANLTRALEALRTDTMFGLIAFAVPGNDDWSVAQGVSTPSPGGVTTRADLYIAGGLDLMIPFPAAFMRELLDAIGFQLSQTPLMIPDSFRETLGEEEEWLLENLDEALDNHLTNGVSNSTFAALLLNLVATRVNPHTLSGPLLAPFSRLSWAEKAEVFRQLEAKPSVIQDAIQARVTDPAFREATTGVLTAMTSFMLRISPFGSYCEFAVFNPATKTLVARPLGWSLTNFQPGAPPPAEGWDEFKGYYQNRRSV